MVKDITVGVMIEALAYGTDYILLGGQTGKKLGSSWNNTKDKLSAYNDFRCNGIFPTFRARDSVITKTTEYVVPVIAIWVAGS